MLMLVLMRYSSVILCGLVKNLTPPTLASTIGGA